MQNNYFNGLNLNGNSQNPMETVRKAASGVDGIMKAKNENDEKTPKIKIEPIDFPKLLETAYTNTENLSTLINSIMKTVFADYYGTKIEVCGNNTIVVTGYFMEIGDTPVPEGKYKGVEQIASKNKEKSNDIGERIKAFNRNASNIRQNYLKLTDDAKKLLPIVVSPAKSNNKIKWDSVCKECSIQTNDMYSRNTVAMAVTFDLIKIIKLIFGGTRNDDTAPYNYMITLGKPLNPVVTATGQLISKNWALFIYRTNLKDISELAESLGYFIRNNNGINCR